VVLLESSGGVFEVSRDGTLIFSKRLLGRHAAPGEVIGMLKSSSGEALS